MSGFTRIHQNIWLWEPFFSLPVDARHLWLMLYTSSPGNELPGIWKGSVGMMAMVAKISFQDASHALQELLDRGMVEYDKGHEVLRMTKLPDTGEYPTAPNIIFAWWNRFNNILPCDVRDRHVTTLRWLIEQGAKDSKSKSKKPSSKHEEVWEETFGTITPSEAPAPSVSVIDNDTSTQFQPSLFSKPNNSNGNKGFREGLGNPQEKEKEKEKEQLSGSHPASVSVSDPEAALVPIAKVIQFPRAPDVLRELVAGFAVRVNAARGRVAHELGMRDVRPIALMGGEQTLLSRLKESADPAGDLDHVLRIAELEAVKKRQIRWLSWSIAEPGAWRVLQAATEDEFSSSGDRSGEQSRDAILAFFDIPTKGTT